MLNRLEKAFSRSKTNLIQTQQGMSHRFDLNRRTHSFRVGDLVLYRIPTRKKVSQISSNQKLEAHTLLLSY